MTFTGTTHDWIASDSATFSFSRWVSEQQPPRAVLVAVHGLSGAALDYEPLGRHLAPYGFATLAIELRGQGNDPLPTRRGDLARLEDWHADLHAFLAMVRREHPGVPLYFYGESMGAALLTRFVARARPEDQPAGLILASPVVALPRPVILWQKWLFHFFLWMKPTLRIDVRRFAKPQKGQPPPYVTRDENHRKWFETAPHKLDRYTIRFFRCLHDLVDGCFADAPGLRVPVLVLYAARDVFITPARVEEFFALIGSRAKELHLFPDAHHLLLHDFDSDAALAEIEQWLLARLPCG